MDGLFNAAWKAIVEIVTYHFWKLIYICLGGGVLPDGSNAGLFVFIPEAAGPMVEDVFANIKELHPSTLKSTDNGWCW